MANQMKFRAVGAVITKYIDRDACMVAAVLKADQLLALSDESRWFEIDLRRVPSRALSWNEVWFDDRGIFANGKPVSPEYGPSSLTAKGITSIGPLLSLPRGQYLGAVYIADHKFQGLWSFIRDPRLDPVKPETPWKPLDWFHYELTSVAQEGDPKGLRRYAGVEGEVVSLIAGTTRANVKFYAPSQRATPFTLQEIDLADPDHCDLAIPPDPKDPTNPSIPEDMLKATPASRGGIYVNLRWAAGRTEPDGRSVFRGPKLPVGMGN